MEDPEQQLANTFPKTPEEFDKVEFLSTTMARIDLVRWMDEIVETHISESNCDTKKFLFFAKTIKSSFLNTNYLYKIQAIINSDKEISSCVLPENIYYEILYKAQKFWTAITTEFEEIFSKYSSSNRYKLFILQIPRKPLSERSIQINQAIVTNDNLMKIMIQLQENSSIILSYIQSWESSKKTSYIEILANTFPKTTEEFDKVEVLSTTLIRTDLVRWMDEMFETHISDSHSDKEKFLFIAKTMKFSLSNINYLYKIQTAINLDKQADNNHISPGNIYYDILLKAHEFWTDINTEFLYIFNPCGNRKDQYASVFQIPKKSRSGLAILIISSIVSNENLMKVMIKLEENSAIILGHIQSWEASTLLTL